MGAAGRGFRGGVIAASTALGTALWSPAAAAFCRTRVCEFPDYPEACTWDAQTKCSASSPFTYWPSQCITFAVQRDGSSAERISASELESVVADGFEIWSNLSCGAGASPALAAASQGPIACDAVEYDCKQPGANSNLIVFRDDFEDTVAFKYGTLALTTTTAFLTTGEILDADIEINSRDEDFVLDGSSALRLSQARDLRSVVYHELGHLLGLSHSQVPGALMRDVYTGSIEPGEDDRAGICDTLESSAGDPPCTVAPLGPDAACVGSDADCTPVSTLEAGASGCACAVVSAPRERSFREPLALVALGAAAFVRGSLRGRGRSAAKQRGL